MNGNPENSTSPAPVSHAQGDADDVEREDLEKTDLVAPQASNTTRSNLRWSGQEKQNNADLEQALALRDTECRNLERKLEEMRAQLQSLRSDFSAQLSELKTENETQRVLLERNTEANAKHEETQAQLRHDNKELKAQNLDLQYHLNQWGLPVESSIPGESAFEDDLAQSTSFFPPLTPFEGSADPVPVACKGDMGTFQFPDLIHFLGNSHYIGVLTLISDGIVSKLYLDSGVLRLASWNNREKERGLTTILRQSEVVSESALVSLSGLPLFDLEVASIVLRQQLAEAEDLRLALKEHARLILGFLFEVKQGTFFFQPGQVEAMEDLQFRLPVIDVLLHTAAEVDERMRVG